MRLKYINIIDLEATCWEDKIANNQKEKSDIIEIGICQLDIRIPKIIKSGSIIVKPTASEVTEYCTNLTTLTPKFIEENGKTFKEACSIIQQYYKTKSLPWVSFGNYDREQFIKQCLREQIEYPLSRNHLNLKTLLDVLFLEKRSGLSSTLNMFKMKFEGTHHRGVDDAINIANIIIKIINLNRKAFSNENNRI